MQYGFGRAVGEYPPPRAKLPQAEHAAQTGASARAAQKERSDLSRGPISQNHRLRPPALTGEATGWRVRGLSQRRAEIQLGSGSSGRSGGSRRGRRSAFDRNRNHYATATTVAATVAAVTTIATTIAAVAAAMAAAALTAAVATAVAAIARAGAAAVVMAAVAAIARRMAAIAAVAAAAAKEASIGLLLTAHEGDSNQREKDRDTQNDDTVHPRILQLLTGTSKRETTQDANSCVSTRGSKLNERDATLRTLREFAPLVPFGPCQALRIAKDVAIAQVRPLR